MAIVEVSQLQGNVPVTVFCLQERIHLGNMADLEDLAKQTYENGMRHLVFDLSQSPTLTSIGVRAIVAIHRMFSEDRRPHVKLAAPTPQIRELLDLAGVTEYIEIYDTVENAVRSF